jgi:hypothetical protein
MAWLYYNNIVISMQGVTNAQKWGAKVQRASAIQHDPQ